MASAVLENPDLLRLIFSHLDHKSLGRALRTNKRWHTLDVEALWKQLCRSRWPAVAALEVKSYKSLYRSRLLAMKSAVNHGQRVPAPPPCGLDDYQFVVDLRVLDVQTTGSGTIPALRLQAVLNGADAHSLNEFREFFPRWPHPEPEGLAWVVDPEFHPDLDSKLLKASEGWHTSSRRIHRLRAQGCLSHLELSVFRKQDQTSWVLVKGEGVEQAYSEEDLDDPDEPAMMQIESLTINTYLEHTYGQLPSQCEYRLIPRIAFVKDENHWAKHRFVFLFDVRDSVSDECQDLPTDEIKQIIHRLGDWH